jgi:hypothetical protein
MRLQQKVANARAVFGGGYEPEVAEIIRAVRPYTMTTPARIAAVCDAVAYIVNAGIDGDFVECGVYKGGSSMAAALRLKQLGQVHRTIHLFDTFSGMTTPSERDRSATSGLAAADLLKAATERAHVTAKAGLDEVKRNMASTGYPTGKIRYVMGDVEATLPNEAPETISILRLDTDWYASTRHELVHLYPRLCEGGILIIDDYGAWEGAKQATDEYFTGRGPRIFLARSDFTGRIGIKRSA